MAFAKVNGTQLHYEIHGNGAPILFVHGLGSSGRDWEKQVAAFSGNYRILTVDLRGHGRSDRPSGPYSISGFADDLAALLRELSMAPVHLIGLSLGGAVALQLAADHPELIRTAVIVNSGPDLRPRTLAQRLQMLQRRMLIRTIGLRPFGRILGKRLFPDAANADDLWMFEQRFADNTPDPYLASLDAVMRCDLTSRLKEIRCPVLVVGADQDYWPISAKEAYVKQMPNARLAVIRNARHAVPVERPDAFNRVVRDFLAAT